MHGCMGRLELIKKEIQVKHGRHMFSDKPYISKLFEINSCLFMLFHVACNHMSFSEVFSFQTETHPLSLDQYWLSSTLVFHISWYSKKSKTQILCVCFISVFLWNFKSSQFSNHFILFSITNVNLVLSEILWNGSVLTCMRTIFGSFHSMPWSLINPVGWEIISHGKSSCIIWRILAAWNRYSFTLQWIEI